MNRKKDRTFAARKLMGPDHHRVFTYTRDLSVSIKKENCQRRPSILGDLTERDGFQLKGPMFKEFQSIIQFSFSRSRSLCGNGALLFFFASANKVVPLLYSLHAAPQMELDLSSNRKCKQELATKK
jgi:hypothetical protein